MTLLDALADALRRALDFTPGEEAPPAAVVWPDSAGAWSSLVPLLRDRLPGLLALGDYAPESGRGPALWLRCAVDGTLPTPPVPEGVTPVLHLPGVGRSTLRTVEALPPDLVALADLPFRGAVFGPEGGKDWTPLSFLVNARDGLDLDVARDAATSEALARALPVFAKEEIGPLRGKRLDAAYFDALIVDDPARDVLRWLDDPEGFQAASDDARWTTFTGVARVRYGVDPEADGPLAAARKLGEAEGAWTAVWDRFAETPSAYTAVPDLLEKVAPPSLGGLFGAQAGRWPQVNDAAEDALREALLKVGGLPAEEAAPQLARLDAEHGPRRGTAWAARGRAPLAVALDALVRLGGVTDRPLAGDSPEALARAYADGGHAADGAALDALAAVSRQPDVDAVAAAARALYLPWLDAHARRLQDLAGGTPPRPDPPSGLPDGTAVLFVDGLRFDVGARLADALDARGYDVDRAHTWAALPSVTPTAKPAASPVADRLGPGADPPPKFATALPDGKALTIDRFRSVLADAEVEVLRPPETGGGSGVAWTETGEIDSDGHHHELRLAHRLPDLVERVAERVEALLDAGWSAVRVVTDHGWLLVPGGLPKAPIALALANDRWGRCALVKKDADVSGLPVVPWHWNPDVRVALAPGVCAFTEGYVYTHGGLSLQEAVVPTLTVTRSEGEGGRPALEDLRWVGFRLRVYLSETGGAATAELRTRAADPASRVAGPAEFDDAGAAALLVEDDRLEGETAVLVVLDAQGRPLLQHDVVIAQP